MPCFSYFISNWLHRVIKVELDPTEKEEIAFVGDDPEADVAGALGAGLQPVWTTYVRDNNITPAPGVVGKGEKDPDLKVPRISDWEDLLSLLNV